MYFPAQSRMEYQGASHHSGVDSVLVHIDVFAILVALLLWGSTFLSVMLDWH